MATFTDRDGNEWQVEIHFSTLSDIKDKLGLQAIPQDEDEAESELTQKVRDNPALIPEVLALACGDEDYDEALAAFDRGPMNDVIQCFNEAWSDFLGQDITQDSPTGADESD